MAEWNVPQGAEEADGVDGPDARGARTDRQRRRIGSRSTQDYRWGRAAGARDITLEELKLAVRFESGRNSRVRERDLDGRHAARDSRRGRNN